MKAERQAGPRVLARRDTRGVSWLTINRPEVRNALDFELLGELAAAVDEEGRGASVLVISGAGDRAFSSGFDLNRLSGTIADLEADRAIGLAADAIRDCPVPVLAAVRGHCHGAAVELALSCDLRFASSDMRLGVPAVRLGVVYRPQLVARLGRLAGLGRAADLLLGGRIIDAQEAWAAGLITEVLDPGQLEKRVQAVAHDLAGQPPEAVRGTKAVLRRLDDNRLTVEGIEELETWRAKAAASQGRRDALATARAQLRGRDQAPEAHG